MLESYVKKVKYLSRYFGSLPVILPHMTFDQKMRYFSIMKLFTSDEISYEQKIVFARELYGIDIQSSPEELNDFLNDDAMGEAFDELKVHCFFNKMSGALN